MAHNPLLGNRISLISKKNIRYEGTLYSINEADATVALADVRSYGTEGREKLDPTGLAAYVPPQDAVHPYLLFRGCDIKDLHVHERMPEDNAPQQPPPPPDPAIVSTQVPSEINKPPEQQQRQQQAPQPPLPPQQKSSQQISTEASTAATSNEKVAAAVEQPKTSTPTKKPSREEHEPNKPEVGRSSTPTDKTQPNGQLQRTQEQLQQQFSKSQERRQKPPENQYRFQNGAGSRLPLRSGNYRGGYSRRPRRNDTKIGTGASLLNRKARGAVEGGPDPTPGDDFDFESSALEFKEKATIHSDNSHDEEAHSSTAYSKDDFFDSISCDALDKQSGIDNRLRGAAERNLNMDTFGAVSLGTGRRGGRRNRRRGGGGGGRGRGRGAMPRENQRWKKGMDGRAFSSGATAHQLTRAGGDR